MTSPNHKEDEEEASLLEQDLANLQLDCTHLAEDPMEIEAGAAANETTAAADLPQFMPDEDGKMRKLVSQDCINELLKLPPRAEPLPDYSVEALRRAGFTDEQEIQTVAMGFWALQQLRDIHDDIVRQYLHEGYAFVPLPDYSNCPFPPPGNMLPPGKSQN